MPTNVEVHVRGLALCYVRDRKWNVHFVCDPSHPLHLRDPDGFQPPLRVQGQNFIGEFIGGFAGNPFNETLPPELFNLNGSQAHNGDLKLLERNCYNTSKILVKLPPSVIDVQALAFNYCVQEVKVGASPQAIQRMATVIRFTFILESEQMTVRIGNYDKTFQSAGKLLKFEFDNRCASCGGNDSLHFYDIVKDPLQGGTERRFVTGEPDQNGNVPDHDSGGPVCVQPTFLSTLRSVLNAKKPVYPHGNCDPDGSEPPPNP